MSTTFTSYADFRQRYPIQFGDDSTWLGTGTYGKVMKVEDQVETEWVAIKISEYRHDDAKSLKAEVELAQKVPRHANIARYDACYRLETEVGVSDFAIMKYYPEGNLADLMKSQRLSDGELRELVRGILEGLKVLHQQRIVHRDFKPANILISRDNRGRLIPKIADFGLSKFVAEEEIESSDFDLSDGRGTPSYKAPEQIVGGRVSFNLDLWAFGVILYEMITGDKPFNTGSQSSENTQRRELERRITMVQLPDGLNTVPEPFQSMICLCLVKDIRQRVRKPDDLLAYLEKPTTQSTPARPNAKPLPAEEPTDVYVASASTSQKPSGLDKGRAVSYPVSVASPLWKGSWLWGSAAGVIVLGSLIIWGMNSSDPIEQKKDSIASITADSLVYQPVATKNTATILPVTKNDFTRQLTKTDKSAGQVIAQKEPDLTKSVAENEQKAAMKKKQLQDEYDNLIEQGNGLISSTNNKTGAMQYFTQARQLAETNNLNTTKGASAYTNYLEKGNRIYANEAYEGAKAWYKLAQAVRPTEEVSRKIRDCEINI